MKPNETLLDLLLEAQGLDRVPRMGWRLRGVVGEESVAEHAFHVAFLAWVLAPSVPGVDPGRLMAMALVHDLAELRIGDLPRTAARYLPESAKSEAERAALAEIAGPLGERATELFDDYERGQSPEARLVKACDKLQLMLKVAAYESAGAGGLAEFWDNPDNFPGEELEPVRTLIADLRSRRGERQRVT